jgi:hypothetical protein
MARISLAGGAQFNTNSEIVMDGASEQSGQGQRRLLTSPCPAQLSQRREHLSHLLQRHVALIDEIQRSAKVRGYIAAHITSLVVL